MSIIVLFSKYLYYKYTQELFSSEFLYLYNYETTTIKVNIFPSYEHNTNSESNSKLLKKL